MSRWSYGVVIRLACDLERRDLLLWPARVCATKPAIATSVSGSRPSRSCQSIIASPSSFVRSVAPDRDKGDADERERNQDEGHDVESS
jgi:hypothetical protein